MKFSLKLMLLALTLLMPCLAVAADQGEPTIYVIKQGDTLWGLSDRFIKDPNYWPNMWSKNSQITNPHLIYPGQKVRVFPDRLEFVAKEEEPASQKKILATPAATAATKEALAEVAKERTYSVHGSEGFILETGAKPAGIIVSIHNNRNIAGDDDIVYTDIGRKHGAKGGEKYSVYRVDGNVKHPVSNEVMGSKITPLGTLQLTDLEQEASRGIIIRTNQEITPKSYLQPYRDNKRREIPLKMATRDLNGYVVDSYSASTIIATGDIVYIDLGSNQGAEPGNMLYVVRNVTVDTNSMTGFTKKLPMELLGALVILETNKNTSTAIVVKSIDAIYKGDKIISQTK